MTDEKVFTGIHAIKSNTGNFHAVAVFLNLCNDYVERYGLLMNEEPYSNLDEVLDDMEDLASSDILSVCVNQDGLDKISIYHPSTNLIGETVKGRIVGFHIDYKRQSKKSRRSPILIANAAVLINEEEVHFVCADKMEIPIDSFDNDSFSESVIVNAYMEDIWSKFEFGSEVIMDIVPVGRHRARYVLREVVPPSSFWEMVLQGLRDDPTFANLGKSIC